ncbi:MAG: regulator of sigma E protease [Chitinophagales bacterium]|jgi:regulator of sigma E protease
MMEILETVLIAIVTFSILVAFHEYGHFWVARKCGVKVLRFSIGFGPVLFTRKDKLGTEFSLSALPLGGYVKMLDEREGEVDEAERHMAFNNKKPLPRIAIVSAGPIANFILAFVAYWLVFVSGVTGVVPIIGEVTPGSAAERAGLTSGQEILSIENEPTPTWRAVSMQLISRLGETGEINTIVSAPESKFEYNTKLLIKDWLVGEGDPDILGSLGISPYRPVLEPIVEDVLPASAAAQAGFIAGDKLLQADDIALTSWSDWVEYVQPRAGESIAVLVDRGGELGIRDITPARHIIDDGSAVGRVGMRVIVPDLSASMIREFKYSPLDAVGEAAAETWKMSVFTLQSIKKLIEGLISPKNLSGPITIAKVATASAKAGFESYLSILALLSISLGVLNLLPIPVLDGGHILFYTIEWLKGSPVPQWAQNIGYQLGLVMVVCLMFFALYNDIGRL